MRDILDAGRTLEGFGNSDEGVRERLENVENYVFIYFIETAKAGSLSFCFLFVYCISFFFFLSLFVS